MRFGDFPIIQQGTKWWNTSAQQWQNLVRAVKAATTVTLGPGLTGGLTETGLRIGLSSESEVPTASSRKVAITALGGDGTNWMMCREVHYANQPPVAGEVTFYGLPFVCYPDVNHTRDEYEDYVWEGGAPDDTTKVLDAYRRDTLWYVHKPETVSETVGKYAVFRGWDDPNGTTVNVEIVKKHPAGGIHPWDSATWELTGELHSVRVYPGSTPDSYATMILPPGADINSLDHLLKIRCIYSDGQEWTAMHAWQTIRGS